MMSLIKLWYRFVLRWHNECPLHGEMNDSSHLFWWDTHYCYPCYTIKHKSKKEKKQIKIEGAKNFLRKGG